MHYIILMITVVLCACSNTEANQTSTAVAVTLQFIDDETRVAIVQMRQTEYVYGTQTATQWTSTPTPTATRTPTPTNTPTITSTPTDTLTPSITPIPSNTPIPTDTLESTIPPPSNTRVRYITARANARSCPQLDCPIVSVFNYGDTVDMVQQIDGDPVNGNDTWYEIFWQAQTIFIHSSLISSNRPSTGNSGNVSVPAVQNTSPAPQPPAQPQWSCAGDVYNCDDFSTCSEMYAYFQACPGDPSNLDGNNDGRPCESRCG